MKAEETRAWWMLCSGYGAPSLAKHLTPCGWRLRASQAGNGGRSAFRCGRSCGCTAGARPTRRWRIGFTWPLSALSVGIQGAQQRTCTSPNGRLRCAACPRRFPSFTRLHCLILRSACAPCSSSLLLSTATATAGRRPVHRHARRRPVGLHLHRAPGRGVRG